MRLRQVLGLAILIVVGCDDGGDPDVDGGTQDGSFVHDAVVTCARVEHCDDGLFCTGTERCAPGDPSADGRGCIAGTRPCASDLCDESARRCNEIDCTNPDADGDGHDAIACGGDDCDDEDGDRHPGNAEDCDDHDEDCDGDSVGGTDADGDGYVDVACTNPEYETGGDDCDDADININPGATETCDGADNDCSSGADDASGLCPGGTCSAGVCDFLAWNRTIGGPGSDGASAVAIDDAGAIYVAGTIQDAANLGLGTQSVAGPNAMYVVKYTPDSVPVWAYVAPERGSVGPVYGLAVSRDGSGIAVVGAAGPSTDLGDGGSTSAVGGNYILLLSGAGEFDGAHRTRDIVRDVVFADGGDVLVSGDRDVGTLSQRSLVVARFAPDLTPVWEREFFVAGTVDRRFVLGESLALDSAENVVVAGYYRLGQLTIGETVLPEGANAFAVKLGSDGAPMWARAFECSFCAMTAVEVGLDDRIYLGGSWNGTIDVGTPVPTFTGTDKDGIIVGLTASGDPSWAYALGGAGGDDSANGLAVSGSGTLYVAGGFATPTDFGSGTIRSPTSTGVSDGFLARYSSLGVHSLFTRYAAGGSQTSVQDVAVGPGGSVVVVGNFTGRIDLSGGTDSAGASDGFIVRF